MKTNYEENNTISLCMIVKNEESNISRCLSSVKGIVDEIIVVDTGSTDNTIEEVKKFGAKVIKYEWNDNFSSARNIGLKEAKCDWILILDADEEITDDSKDRLYDAIQFDNGVAVFVNIIEKVNNIEVQVPQPRLFRNYKDIEFSNTIAESITDSILRLIKDESREYKTYSLYINHFGIEDKEKSIKKSEKYIEMSEKAIEEYPESVSTINIILGLTNYSRNLNHHPENIINLITKASKIIEKNSDFFREPFQLEVLKLNLILIDLYLRLDNLNSAISLINKFIPYFPRSLNLFYLRYFISAKQENMTDAFNSMLACKKLLDDGIYNKYEILPLTLITNDINSKMEGFKKFQEEQEIANKPKTLEGFNFDSGSFMQKDDQPAIITIDDFKID